MYCIMDSKESCSMMNPMVIDLTVEESDEDSPSKIEEVPSGNEYSDKDDLSTEEEGPNAHKKIKVESNRK